MSEPHGGAPSWTLNASILVGAGVIAVAIYAGLREKERTPSAATNPSSQTSSSDAAAASRASGSSASGSSASVKSTGVTSGGATAQLTPAASTTAIRPDAEVDQDIAKALGSLREKILRDCYTPFKDDPEMPKRLKFIYSGSFNASGVEVGRAISDSREGYFEASSSCVRKLPMNMTIPASGAMKNVQQPIEVP